MKIKTSGIIMAVAAGWMAVQLVSANPIYVDLNATGANNGSSWVNAYVNLQTAIDAAGDGDTLWVAEGTYQNNYDDNDSFVIDKAELTLYGGFTNGMAALDDRDATAYPTILDGDNARHVLALTQNGTDITLDSLTVQRGRLPVAPGGGGIRANLTGENTLVMRNCRILNTSHSSAHGERSGAGLYAANVHVTIEDCLFQGNTTFGVNGSRAGGIYLTGGSLTVRDTRFFENGSGHHNNSLCGGGAAWILNAPASFSNSVFHANTANSSARQENAFGGALFFSGAGHAITLDNCVLTENTGYQGGAIAVGSGTLVLRHGTVAGNSALGNGAERGGAIYLLGINHQEGADGGGSMYATNTIFRGNQAVEGKVVYCPGTSSAHFHYCNAEGTDGAYFQGNVTISNLTTNDPLFADAYANVHLKSAEGRWDPDTENWVFDAVTSPAIDAGDPDSDFKHELDPDGGRVNLGAYGNTPLASKSLTAEAPQVENRDPAVFQTMAVMQGELVSGTPSDITFWYGTNMTSLDLSVTLPFRQATGSVFSVSVGDLEPNAQYWYVAVASNAAGENTDTAQQTFSTTVALDGGAEILHVDKNAPSPAETGRDWCNAFKTVKAALASASGTTNTLWIAQGTYADGGTAAIGASVNVYGGFTNGMTQFEQRNPATHPVILDGENMRRIAEVTADGLSVFIDGVTLQHGIAFDTPGGGAILANRTGSGNSIALRDCRILNNRSVVRENRNGAGIYAANIDLTLDECLLEGNSTHGLNNTRGGGIYLTGGSLTARDTSFIANRGGSHSGALSGGGAAWILNAPVAFTNCSFVSNTANSHNSQNVQRAGALYLSIGAARTAQLVNCQFRDNVCRRRGGAIVVDSGTVNIRNASFTSNSIDETDEGNDSMGGAIYVGGGTVNVKNSILWNNTSFAGAEIYATGEDTTANIAYTLITSTNSPDDVAALDGASMTFADGILEDKNPLFASETDLHLQSRMGRWDPVAEAWTSDEVSSPAIDAGDPADLGWQNEPRPHGGRINLGAYGGTPYASQTWVDHGSLFIIR